MEDHEYVSAAKRRIKDDGFPLPCKPVVENLQWPSSVQGLSTGELAEHLTIWSGWAGYTRVMLAIAEANKIAYKSQQTVYRSSEMVKQERYYKTVTALKAAVDSSGDMLRYVQEATQAKIEKKFLVALLYTYEERVSVISREITRRRQDYDDSRRQ